MLIICEDCAKRYNIDESRIKSNRARFTCKECGHIIIVEKSDTTRRLISGSLSSHTSKDEYGSIDLLREMEDTTNPSITHDSMEERSGQITKEHKKNVPVFYYFLLPLLAAFLCSSGVLGYLYIVYIADSLQQAGMQTDFLVRSLLLLCLSWALALGVFFLITRFLAKSITNLKI